MAQRKTSTSTRALSIYIGRALLPGKDGRPQRKVTHKEAWEIAKEREQKWDRCNEGR